jgi:hypothetical protein
MLTPAASPEVAGAGPSPGATPTAALVRVPFRGEDLPAVRAPDGACFIPVRPYCDRLGVAFPAQFRKLNAAQWAVVTILITTGADGKNYGMACIPLEALPMWLASISPRRVDKAIRPTLIAYQQEAADVLAQHFLGRPLTPPALPPAAPALPPAPPDAPPALPPAPPTPPAPLALPPAPSHDAAVLAEALVLAVRQLVATESPPPAVPPVVPPHLAPAVVFAWACAIPEAAIQRVLLDLPDLNTDAMTPRDLWAMFVGAEVAVRWGIRLRPRQAA